MLDERAQIDINAPPLISGNEMPDELGLLGDLIAAVHAGSKDFLIIDTRDTRTNRDFLIVDEAPEKSRTSFKGVLDGEAVIIGRGHHTDRFSYPDTVAREHFAVLYVDGALFIHNLQSTSVTTVTARLADGQQQSGSGPFTRRVVEDERTHCAEDRLQAHPNFGEKDETAPYGYYMNHPILGRASTSVDGGVYLGGSAREAIVVDGKSVAMEQVYESVASKVRQSFEDNKTLPVSAILLEVMHTVQAVMPYDDRKAEAISRQHYGDKLIGLSTYIKERAGVCRHQGLLAAYILENLIRDGHISGAVGIERNTIADMGGTHAWAVYKIRNNGAEEAIVVDPAQSFIGTKAQAQHEGRWEYRLTTDEY